MTTLKPWRKRGDFGMTRHPERERRAFVAPALLVVVVWCGLMWNGCVISEGGQEVAAGIEELQVEDDLVENRTGACADLPDLTGTAYLVYELFATEPTDVVNEIWAEYVEANDLAIIFLVTAHDLSTGMLQFEVTSAHVEVEDAGTDEERAVGYRFALAPGSFGAKVDGCDFNTTGEFELELVTPSLSHRFPIRRSTGAGTLSPDGSAIEELRLSGFLPEDNIVDLCMAVEGLGFVNLHWFFNLAGVCPDADWDEDGEVDSYNFKGIVRAADASPLFFAGVEPIVAPLDECAPDTKECVGEEER